jgi:hypothetical protein
MDLRGIKRILIKALQKTISSQDYSNKFANKNPIISRSDRKLKGRSFGVGNKYQPTPCFKFAGTIPHGCFSFCEEIYHEIPNLQMAGIGRNAI